ncbi:MAG: UDP-N-acetylmuramoyl-L-alanyl-D-glutamate--2,6-diaminopimelate ligase [Eubacteriales bacterium]
MRLSSLLEELSYECVRGTIECEIAELVYDSRKVVRDSVFLCIEGANVDGHTYAQSVVQQGASVLIVSKDVEVADELEVTILQVEDTRYALAVLSAAFFGHPARTLKVIGITGTKGKTTTTYLVKSILEQAGYKVGLIGTIETIIGDTVIPSLNTTPESYVLQQYFRQMVEVGCEIAVMEVSSQGLMMHRTQGFVFEIGVFTNIQPDHIGEHEHTSYEHYMECKSMLFRQCKIGLINGDDKEHETIIHNHTCTIEKFGLGVDTDLRARNVKLLQEKGNLGVTFIVEGELPMEVSVATPGTFSVYNALTAIAICKHFLVEPKVIQKALLEAHVKGRIEVIKVSKEFTLMIDYAHNAMSLDSLLTTLQEYKPKRLVCLFGCGGNRAKSRRYEMGEVAGRLADLTIITSDNPRFEEPMAIIEDIKEGMSKTSGTYVEIPDRKEAIRYAIVNAQIGDIVVLAGKGHEDYQEIKGTKYPMDERVLIKEILKEEGL